MTSQDVISEIRSLKSDLNTFSDHMVQLRYEDLKGAFLEQMRMAVGEEGKRAFQDDVTNLQGSSGCDLKTECLKKLGAAVDIAARSFMRDDIQGAKDVLDEVEGLIKGDCSPCQDGGCSQAAAETLRRVRAILQVYEGLAERLGHGSVEGIGAVGAETPSAEGMESILDPLANAWRIKILMALRRGNHSLSELARAVELKTGHLQFHLRALVRAGFVILDRRKHRYSLTDRGALALGCAEDLVSKVGPTATEQAAKYVRETGNRGAADAL
jgi:DNA-binding HxlR family transcriptional regulator